MAIPLERLEGKYEILEKLREGGMGAIYKVRHRLHDELRVIKMVRPRHAGDASVRARFLEEARVAARLDHPGLAKTYDFVVDDDGAAYLVMELIPGITLGELMRTGHRLPVGLVLEIARQALETIAYLHRQGVVHRDVSPDNLMLSDIDGEPRVHLIDFGLVKRLEGRTGQLTAAGMFVGKFRYAAPEQFDDGGDSPQADLYSFAVVLYELLTGRYPIAGDGPSSLIAGHLFRPPLAFESSDPEGKVPEPVRRAVLRGLEKAPGDRFEDAESFAAALASSASFDPSEPEVVEILDATRGDALPRLVPAPRPGSTQVRFDRQFLAEPTPAPETTRPLAISRPGPRESEPPVLPEPAEDTEDVSALLRRAREERRAGRLDEAIALADRARRLAPQHALIRVLLFDLERERDDRQADAARRAERGKAEDEIRQLVADGCYEQAARRLPEALDVAGPTLVLQNLQAQVESQIGSGVDPGPLAGETEADEMLQAARRKARDEDFEGAKVLLGRVLDKMPDDPEALALQVSVDVCLEARAAEVRQEREVERTLAGIQTLLDTGKTSAALVELGRAEEHFGDYADFGTLHQDAVRTRVLELQEEHDGKTQIMAVPPQPRETSPLKDVERSGAPVDPSTSSEVESSRGVAEITATIRRYQSEGRPGRALKELQRAIKDHGQTATFRTLRSELGQQMLDRDADEDRSAELSLGPVGDGLTVEPGSGGSSDLSQGEFRQAATGPMDLPLGSGGPVSGGPVPGAGALGSVPPAPDAGFAMSEGRTRRASGRGKIVGIVVLVLVSLLAGVGLSRLGVFGKAGTATEEPAAEAPPVVVEPGFLRLDARPWAEIVSIRAVAAGVPGTGEGEDGGVEISPSRFTPVVLELPAGTYRILLRHPPSGHEEEVELEIESGISGEYRWTAEELDGTKYFEKVGW